MLGLVYTGEGNINTARPKGARLDYKGAGDSTKVQPGGLGFRCSRNGPHVHISLWSVTHAVPCKAAAGRAGMDGELDVAGES